MRCSNEVQDIRIVLRLRTIFGLLPEFDDVYVMSGGEAGIQYCGKCGDEFIHFQDGVDTYGLCPDCLTEILENHG